MNEIAAFEIGPRAGISERADPQIDQSRIGRSQSFEGEVPVGKIAARTRIQHDVGGGREPQERLLPVGLVEIDDDAALAEVVVPEMQALLRRRHIPAERPDSPRRFAFRRLDLYDVGAQACEHPAGILSRLVCKLEHSDAVEISTLVPASVSHAPHLPGSLYQAIGGRPSPLAGYH